MNLEQEEINMKEASSTIKSLKKSGVVSSKPLDFLNWITITKVDYWPPRAKSCQEQNDETPSNPTWSKVTRQPKRTKNKQLTKEHQATRVNASLTIIMVYSIVKRLRNDRLSRSTRSKVQVCSFPGTHIEDMYHYTASTLKTAGASTHHSGQTT